MPSSEAARSRLLLCFSSASVILASSASRLISARVEVGPARISEGVGRNNPRRIAIGSRRMIASGKSSGRIERPAARATARSIEFFSSRMLPGQSYSSKSRRAGSEIESTVDREPGELRR